jgi:hypothetical protein
MAEGRQGQQQNSGAYTLAILLSLFVAGTVLVLIVRAIFSLLASAEPEVTAAVVVTAGTILVSVASLIVSNRYQVRLQLQQRSGSARRRSMRRSWNTGSGR